MADHTADGFRALAVKTGPEADQRTDKVGRQVAQLNADEARDRRTDYTRLVLAVVIMLIYLGSVGTALFWFGSRIPPLVVQGKAPSILDPYSSAMLDILKVLVLPVVTLMLGFYFGTGASTRSNTAK